MMLAEISQGEIWIVVCSVAGTVISLIALLVIAFKKTDTVISPQPLIIAMQKEFATKHEFDNHVAANAEEHKGIFSKIGGVERGATQTTDQKVEVVRKDLIHVGNQVAGLQAETKMQSVQLNRMEKTISDMPGKIVADIVNAKKL
jgi:hypothetical protein